MDFESYHLFRSEKGKTEKMVFFTGLRLKPSEGNCLEDEGKVTYFWYLKLKVSTKENIDL